jgi:TrmH family RNA methyltransferase
MADINYSLEISSLTNPRIKNVVKLRQRSHRDDLNCMLIEGFREISRALDNSHPLTEIFFCEELFQGQNNRKLLERCNSIGAKLISCTTPVFRKISYRDRPDGLLATAPQVKQDLSDLKLKTAPFIVIAEAIEKPGNLGTILRSSDAAGVDAVIVCDRCTDINNPNVVRASVGTIFSVPVVETSSSEVIQWLRQNNIQAVATTPHTDNLYSNVNLTAGVAIVVGTEQYGLSDTWLDAAEIKVRIPMLGQADSLNVASATTILLYEVVRQRNPQK